MFSELPPKPEQIEDFPEYDGYDSSNFDINQGFGFLTGGKISLDVATYGRHKDFGVFGQLGASRVHKKYYEELFEEYVEHIDGNEELSEIVKDLRKGNDLSEEDFEEIFKRTVEERLSEPSGYSLGD